MRNWGTRPNGCQEWICPLLEKREQWGTRFVLGASPIELIGVTFFTGGRLSNMRNFFVVLFGFAVGCCVLAGAQQSSVGVQRTVTNNTLKSASDPAITLEVDKSFQYVGGQSFDIFHVAAAEQHLFVDAGPGRSVRRFYWVQFEHYLPDNKFVYDYTGIEQKPLQIGPLKFMEDTAVVPDYFTSDNRSGSDSEAALNLLRKNGYAVDGRFIRVRMFYLPDVNKRKELMLIYGEKFNAGASEEEAKGAALRHAEQYVKILR